MAVDRINADPNDLAVAAVELRPDLGHVAKLGRAHRREILRMRKQDTPRVAYPGVELDWPFRGIRHEVRSSLTDTKRHGHLLVRLAPNRSLGTMAPGPWLHIAPLRRLFMKPL